MKRKIKVITAEFTQDLETKVNDFLEEEGARWRLVSVVLNSYGQITAWLEFEG